MFSKLALIVTSACALAAVAAPTSGGGGSCNSSGQSLQCCNSTESASNPSDFVSVILALLHINPATLTGNIGVTCTSLVGGSSCNQQTVCCNNNNFSGLIAIGCTPINIGL
ncbi:hypothetical protein K443DRAFT_99090 [Laccaria amethystina LaAM-08-1]|uniref:Hydrophobin n=1 Tax=Laccaria amethystina LaAM-08-1 TaxID=1095629 RepID=A0A0C9X7Z5_9AGAR|nr:hypothetical protein K443DRAFT_99090 [Laccaria amethystina LaAM-08-1]